MKNNKLATKLTVTVLAMLALTAHCRAFQLASPVTGPRKPQSARSIILNARQNWLKLRASTPNKSTLAKPGAFSPRTASQMRPSSIYFMQTLIGLLIPSRPVTIPVGLNRQFNATGVYSDGSSRDLTHVVTWTSSDATVATIDTTGKAAVSGDGVTVITASVGSFSAATTLAGVRAASAHLFADFYSPNSFQDFSVQSSGALAMGSNNLGFSDSVVPITAALNSSQNWLFLTNSNNQIASFAVDQNTWALSGQSSMQATGNTPVAMAVNGPHNVVYTANINSNDISAFSFDSASGALTPVAGSPFAAGDMPDAIVTDPSGRHVYVANMNANTISIYSVDQNGGGALVHLVDQTLPGAMPVNMVMDPTGSFLYVAENATNDVAVFSVDPNNGTLLPVPGSPVAAGTSPFSIVIDPSGSYVYVAAYGNVLSFKVDARTGSLSSNGGINLNASIDSLAMDPSGQYLYSADWNYNPPGQIVTMAINPSSGVLTQVDAMSFTNYPGSMLAAAGH